MQIVTTPVQHSGHITSSPVNFRKSPLAQICILQYSYSAMQETCMSSIQIGDLVS